MTSPHRFIVVVPQDRGAGRAVADARERLEQLLDSLRRGASWPPA